MSYPDIITARKIYDGTYVYDHTGAILAKVTRYNDNYRLWQISLWDDEGQCFCSPSGLYDSQKAALNEIREQFGYEAVQ